MIGDASWWQREYCDLYDAREREQHELRNLVRVLYDATNPHCCGDVTCCSPLPADHPLYAVLVRSIEATVTPAG